MYKTKYQYKGERIDFEFEVSFFLDNEGDIEDLEVLLEGNDVVDILDPSLVAKIVSHCYDIIPDGDHDSEMDEMTLAKHKKVEELIDQES